MIKAEIVADSLSPQGDRLTSLLITFPRFILAEVNTHRMLSKNTSSSRAIPFMKMLESVQNDPFTPIAWQKQHSGMQGSEYIIDEEQIRLCNNNWLNARDNAVSNAHLLSIKGATKQLCNRLLEPFMWTTMLITGSKEGWDNFFELRCPNYEVVDSYGDYNFYSKKQLLDTLYLPHEYKDYSTLDWLKINKGQAEIHMMDLAEKIYDAMNESEPDELFPGGWHIPFFDVLNELEDPEEDELRNIIKASVAMAARTSYTVVGDEKELKISDLVDLHDKLVKQTPPHSSPMEHCARAMNNEEYYLFNRGEAYIDGWHKSPDVLSFTPENRGWCRNFKGFIPYRHIIETQNE